MNKVNHNQPQVKSFEEADQTLLNIAVFTITAENKQNELDQLILELKKKYEPDILALNTKIKTCEEQLDKFCKANKKAFEGKRSRDLTYGRIGFRTGKNSLKLLSKAFTWEIVKEKLQDLFGTKYVEVKFKIDKRKIVSDSEKGILNDEQLTVIGCKTYKGEKTFYDLFREKINVESLD